MTDLVVYLADLSGRIQDTLDAYHTGNIDLKSRRERQKARKDKAFANAGGSSRSYGGGQFGHKRLKTTVGVTFRGSEPEDPDEPEKKESKPKKSNGKKDEKKSAPCKKSLSADDSHTISTVFGA